MADTICCNNDHDKTKPEYETVAVKKTGKTCQMCENYSKENQNKQVAIMCCEGACLRGEIARQAANILCHRLVPDKTVRICLGGAFRKNTGQRNLVRNAQKLIALEGCFLECSTRMMQGVLPGLAPKIIIADTLYDFDRQLFGINEMMDDEIRSHARTVADEVIRHL